MFPFLFLDLSLAGTLPPPEGYWGLLSSLQILHPKVLSRLKLSARWHTWFVHHKTLNWNCMVGRKSKCMTFPSSRPQLELQLLWQNGPWSGGSPKRLTKKRKKKTKSTWETGLFTSGYYLNPQDINCMLLTLKWLLIRKRGRGHLSKMDSEWLIPM